MVEHEACEVHRFCHPFLQHEKNNITGILGIKKEPYGSNVKNIKQVIVIDYLQFYDIHILFKIHKKVSFYSLHAVEGSRLLALLVKLFLKFCR